LPCEYLRSSSRYLARNIYHGGFLIIGGSVKAQVASDDSDVRPPVAEVDQFTSMDMRLPTVAVVTTLPIHTTSVIRIVLRRRRFCGLGET
jgi:hypothetical protein